MISLLIESILDWFAEKAFIKLCYDLFVFFVMNVVLCSLCFEFVNKVIFVSKFSIFYSSAF